MQHKKSSTGGGHSSMAITGQVIHNAWAIIARPDTNHPQSLRRWAWAVLKSARGQSISQSGLNRLTGRHRPAQGRAT